GIIDAYDKKIGQVRKHEGQVNTAANLRLLLKGSNMITRQGEARVQDAYSLRCVPQVHGASKDTFKYVQEKIEIEMNSATDNPLIFTDSGEVISGGNFHGQPLALPFDFLGIAVAELANISERRIERLVNPTLNNGLPAFLIGNAGLNSGFMITQYVAASLVSENKVLSHPASVDSIPSSANQEDHVSMGTIAARKAAEIIDNAYKVIAIEAIAACQAIDLRAGKELGLGTQVAYSMVREGIKTVKEDKIMYVDICDCEEMLRKGGLVGKVEKIVGQLW
ncbi:MAG TPA: aromatic amino acid lyase, partial [Tissierellaceae bacterium]|nr:aromatic amino acid lyase [Tissierellaceae bacterium]